MITHAQFPSGFFWQLFGFAAQNSSAALFALATGVGDALGVFVGQILLYVVLKRIKPSHWTGWSNAVLAASVIATASFCSGTAWQPAVNTAAIHIDEFTAAALFVGLICGVFFFLGLTCANESVAAVLKVPRQPRRVLLAHDVSLSVAVVGAAAFFVGTDQNYPGNWLSPVVGERSGASVGLDSFKAGLSTALGFAVFQCVLVLATPAGLLWTDDIASSERVSHASRAGDVYIELDGRLLDDDHGDHNHDGDDDDGGHDSVGDPANHADAMHIGAHTKKVTEPYGSAVVTTATSDSREVGESVNYELMDSAT